MALLVGAVTVTAAPAATRPRRAAPTLRVNAGGPKLAGTPPWSADSATTPSPYATASGGNRRLSTTTTIVMRNPSLPAGTPATLFRTARSANRLTWRFPVPAGLYSVRLYFAEIDSDTAVLRQPDVRRDRRRPTGARRLRRLRRHRRLHGKHAQLRHDRFHRGGRRHAGGHGPADRVRGRGRAVRAPGRPRRRVVVAAAQQPLPPVRADLRLLVGDRTLLPRRGHRQGRGRPRAQDRGVRPGGPAVGDGGHAARRTSTTSRRSSSAA